MFPRKFSFASRIVLELRYWLTMARYPTRKLGPPIFVVGAPHSGTSITTVLLSEHSALYTIPGETRMFTSGNPQFQARLFDKLTFCAGRTRWLEKTPEHLMALSAVFRLHPRAQVLIVLRDGRDVAASLFARTGDLDAGINAWLEANRQSESYIGDPRVLRVKYEELVTEPENTLKSICLFLGLAFEVRMLEYYKKPRRYYANVIHKPPSVTGQDHGTYRNWQINQPIFDGRGRWKKMSYEQKTRTKELAAPELKKYGYGVNEEW